MMAATARLSGRTFAGMLGVFAEFEREILRDRVKAGIAQARKEGRPHGRPAKIAGKTPEIQDLACKGLSKSAIAKQLNIGRTSVRTLARQRFETRSISPAEFASRAARVVARGYTAIKFDPFATAWKRLQKEEEERAIAIVDATAKAVESTIGLMIEVHGRLALGDAIRFMRRLEPYNIVWVEEPVAAENLEFEHQRAREPMERDHEHAPALRTSPRVQLSAASQFGMNSGFPLVSRDVELTISISVHRL